MGGIVVDIGDRASAALGGRATPFFVTEPSELDLRVKK
jgi:hypothetical protein